MPTKSTAAKSPKRQEQDTRAVASAGPKGIALAPPAYGIDFVDRAPAGDGPLQLTPATDRRPEAAKAPAPRRARSTPPNTTGLPDGLKSGIESLSGMSMDGVNVHYNSSRPAQLNALAYTQGRDIHVAPGQERHLPHEAWHVVQQAQGRVKPTMQMKDGVPVNDDKALEYEADVMGEKAAVEGHLTTPSRLSQDRVGLDEAPPQRVPIRGPGEKGLLNFLSTRGLTPVQMRSIIQTEEQSYDRKGTHVSKGTTNPYHLVNTLNNTYSHALSDASRTLYQNAHMLAATFGGSNELDNIVAWNANMETAWSEAENEIRGASNDLIKKAPRPNEKGEVTTNVDLPEEHSAGELATKIFKTAEDLVTDPANWVAVPNRGPEGAGPPTKNELKYETTAAGEPLLLSKFKTRVISDIDNAVKRMPSFAKISYASSEPDDKRKWSRTFRDKSEIAELQVGNKTDCLRQISSMNVLPEVSRHRLRKDL